MAFDLYVTFAGLCLFKRKHNEPMRVLLPDAGMSHRAVVGWHVRYAVRPDATARRFEERPLVRSGELRLDSLTTDDRLNTSLSGLDIVEIFPLMQRPAKRNKALAEVVVGHGSACPPHICEHFRGARWNLCWPHGEYEQHMATALTWRIAAVESRLAGSNEEGIELVQHVGGATPKLGTLRPINGQIRIFVFNVKPGELPSANPPEMETLRPGYPAEHFTAFYTLFDPPAPNCVPEFVDDGTPRELPFIGGVFGRLFTCMVASTDEG
jgi:hypothetical protein